VVEDDDLDLLGQAGLGDFVGLAAADEIRRIGTAAFCGDRGDRRGAGRTRQQGQFFQAGGKSPVPKSIPTNAARITEASAILTRRLARG
jgi:hypothetical protein